jgi:hypothetical protein
MVCSIPRTLNLVPFGYGVMLNREVSVIPAEPAPAGGKPGAGTIDAERHSRERGNPATLGCHNEDRATTLGSRLRGNDGLKSRVGSPNCHPGEGRDPIDAERRPRKAGSFTGVSIGMPIAGGAHRACKRGAQSLLTIGPRPAPG